MHNYYYCSSTDLLDTCTIINSMPAMVIIIITIIIKMTLYDDISSLNLQPHRMTNLAYIIKFYNHNKINILADVPLMTTKLYYCIYNSILLKGL